MLFSLLAILPIFSSVSALPAIDLRYSHTIESRQLVQGGGCYPGSIYCNSPGTFSLCVPGGVNGTTKVFFGPVAPGTYCDQSQMRIRANNFGDCQIDGTLKCGPGGNTFFTCAQGGFISFGPVAAGTTCSNGTIIRST